MVHNQFDFYSHQFENPNKKRNKDCESCQQGKGIKDNHNGMK